MAHADHTRDPWLVGCKMMRGNLTDARAALGLSSMTQVLPLQWVLLVVASGTV
jgi:hypothetical protein